jgi:hypothetical protein
MVQLRPEVRRNSRPVKGVGDTGPRGAECHPSVLGGVTRGSDCGLPMRQVRRMVPRKSGVHYITRLAPGVAEDPGNRAMASDSADLVGLRLVPLLPYKASP